MKLWKFNAVLFICMIGMVTVQDLESEMTDLESLVESSMQQKLKNGQSNDNEDIQREIQDAFQNDLSFLESQKLGNEYENIMELENERQPKKKENVPQAKQNSNPNLKLKVNPKPNLKNTKSIIKLKKPDIKKIKIIIEKNAQMANNDRKNLERAISYSKCVHKSGILGLAKTFSPNRLNPDAIVIIPMYVTMSPDNLSFFLSPESITLFNHISLSNILKITQTYIGTSCFDVVINDLNLTSLNKGKVTLCAKDDNHMKDWVEKIEEFKGCQGEQDPLASNKKVLVDFKKVNKLLKDTPRAKNTEIKKLFYNATDKVPRKSIRTIQKEQKLKHEISQIKNIITEGQKAKVQLQRQMAAKLNSAEKFAIEIKKKQDLMQEMRDKKYATQKERFARLISVEHEAREFNILSAVKMKLKQIKMQEIKDYKKSVVDRIKETKKKANEDAKNMMKNLLDENKNGDYSACIDKKLLNFTDKDHVNKTCKILFGENVYFF